MIKTSFVCVVLACSYATSLDLDANVNSHNKVVVCYVDGWSKNRLGNGAFHVDNIDPMLCTHIIYECAYMNKVTYSIESCEWDDSFLDTPENGVGSETFINKKVMNMKQKQPKLKFSIGIGGWDERSRKYYDMATTPENRKTFINSVSAFIKEHGFDGANMDWSYPGDRDETREKDRKNVALFLGEMRAELDKGGLLLTATIYADLKIIDRGYDVPAMTQNLHFIHILTYGYHSPSQFDTTGHNAPLRLTVNSRMIAPKFGGSVEDTVKYLQKLGASPEKMVIGIPSHGTTFTLADRNLHEIGSASNGSGIHGPYTQEDGLLGYNEICIELTQNQEGDRWVEHWDDVAQVPYMYNGDQWVSYENEKSVAIKARYAFNQGLAGLMISSIDTDDFLPKCSNIRYPLLRAINSEFKDLNDINDPVYKIIALKRGVAQNLTCNRLSQNVPVQWLKGGNKFTGPTYENETASVLRLQGKTDEVGTYECRWIKRIGEAGYKIFEVGLFFPVDTNTYVIITSATVIGLLLVGMGIGIKFYISKKNELENMLNGDPSKINPDVPMEYQTEFLPYNKKWEFPRKRLRLGQELGSGFFGRVVKAEAVGLKDSDETVTTVAVKMIKPTAKSKDAIVALIRELKILIYLGEHLNVVNLLGACTKTNVKEELLVIIDFCRFGNLKSHLMKHRDKFIDQLNGVGDMIPENEMDQIGEELDATLNEIIKTRDLISWSLQIARGMEFLASKKVLHGDLAARNVLLADGGIVKVADFGMARQMKNYEYKKREDELLPLKWMAIESLTDNIFSSQSDVWSYGILLWEIFSLGRVPYPGMENGFLLAQKIQSGFRMEKPQYAPNFVGDIMKNCWQLAAKERPTFSELAKMIERQIESVVGCDYLNMKKSSDNANSLLGEMVDNTNEMNRLEIVKLFNETTQSQPTEGIENLCFYGDSSS